MTLVCVLLILMSSAHSPTFPSLHLRNSSFSNPSHRFSYVTAHSPTLPLLHLHHRSFSNPSFAFPTPQALHLRHHASCPWCEPYLITFNVCYISREKFVLELEFKPQFPALGADTLPTKSLRHIYQPYTLHLSHRKVSRFSH